MGEKLNLKWVTDTIGNDYKHWRSGDIVTIQAQTGTGKTYFIKNTLIDYLGQYEKLLFICNRVNLKRQLKIDLLKKFGLKTPKDEEGNIDFEELDKLTQIENITIISYQAIQENMLDVEYGKDSEIDLDTYDFIVCDECHYIFSDADFVNKTISAYLKLIYKHTPLSIKIFISATIDELKNCIINCAKKVIGRVEIHEYSTGIDYRYLNVKYFNNNIVDIINLIKNDTSDEKWLIFVSKISDAEKIKETLEEDKTGIAEIIKSGSNNKELESIIKNNKFECKVLVCTKAMDNGINIQDDKLTNIVIMAWDKITFIQELGRKRINIEDAQEVNLYIPTKYKKSFVNRLNKIYDRKIKLTNLLEKNKNEFGRRFDRDYKKLPSDIFYKDKKSGWSINPVGYFRLQKDIDFTNKIINDFKTTGKFAFVKEQLKWLELEDTFSPLNLIEKVILDEDKDNLEEYLNSIVGQVMLESKNRKELIENIKLIDSHNSCIKKNKIKYVNNRETLNSYLLNDLELDFYIKKFETSKIEEGVKKNFKSAWKVLKLSEQ